MVDVVRGRVVVAGVHGQLVDAAGELGGHDAREGLEAHLLRLGDAVLPLAVEAALEGDRRPVPERQAVLLGQLEEARLAARPPVDVLVRVQMGRAAGRSAPRRGRTAGAARAGTRPGRRTPRGAGPRS